MAPHPTTAKMKDLPAFWASTKFNDEPLRFTWTIHNFSLRQIDNGKDIESPVLTSADGLEWILSVYPKGASGEAEGYVSIFLCCLSSNDSTVCPEVKYSVKILNAEQEPIHGLTNSSFHKFKGKDESHGWPKFVKRDDLIKVLKNDLLTMCCEFTICGPNRIDTSGWSDMASQRHILPVPECTLSDDLESLFKDQNSGDTIIEVDGKEFFVHKEILQTRSSVFTAMFQHEMEEHTQSKVIITDFEPEVVEEMLTYIYTGKSPNLAVMANDVLTIADKYDLERLKMMSADVLSRKLTSENAIETLLLADLYRVDDLKHFVINFIITNCHSLDVMAWENIVSSLSVEHPNLIAEIITASLAHKK